jgi:hypothetical protein
MLHQVGKKVQAVFKNERNSEIRNRKFESMYLFHPCTLSSLAGIWDFPATNEGIQSVHLSLWTDLLLVVRSD